jgi:hypothetical protein
VLALMCSLVGVTMALAVGFATLVRRGWRMAVAHTAPLAAVYLLWSVTYGRDAYSETNTSFTSIVTFVRESLVAVFDGLGQIPGVGVLLALVLVVGVPLALTRETWNQFRQFDGPTAGLALGAIFFVATTGYRRAIDSSGFPNQASATRYVYIIAALLLPAIALAANAFVDRWRIALPVAVAIFLVGLPANVAKLHGNGAEATTVGDPDLVLTMARLPLASEVPRDLRPLAPTEASFPIGWLLDGVASGRVPDPPASDAASTAAAELLLSVYQRDDPPSGACTPIESGTRVQVRPGDEIEISGRLVVLRRRIEGQLPAQATYNAFRGRTLEIVGGPLELVVRPTPSDVPAELCR